MSTNWFGRAELKYNQTAETLIVRLAIRYLKGQETLFGDVKNVLFKIGLPSGVEVTKVSRIMIGSPDDLKKMYSGCGFSQAIDIALDEQNFLTLSKNKNGCSVKFSNIAFLKGNLPTDNLVELVVLLPLETTSENGEIKSGECRLTVHDSSTENISHDEKTIRFGRRNISKMKSAKKALNSRISEMMTRPNLIVSPTHSPKEIAEIPFELVLDKFHNSPPITQREILEKNLRVLIESPSGSGKSAFVRQLAGLASSKNISVAYIDCMFLSNEIQETTMTIQELAMVWLTETAGYTIVPEGFFDIAIGRGEALIIIDNLDILSAVAIKRIISNIESLASSTTCPIVISTRPLPQGTSLLRVEKFPYRRTIKKLDINSQLDFADTWFQIFPAEKRSPKRMLSDFKKLTKNPLIKSHINTLSGLNKVGLLMTQRISVSNEICDKSVKILISSLRSFPDIIPDRLRARLKDRRLVSDVTISSTVHELFPALSATLYNALAYGKTLSRENITKQLAKHYVDDNERGEKTALDTANDMINICGPSGLGLISFEGGRILPVDRSFIEFFASFDRAIGFHTAHDWSKRTAHDGVFYPGSWSIQLATFLRLLKSRRPKFGFQLLTSLANELIKTPDSIRVSTMIFGKALSEAGYLLAAQEPRNELIKYFSKTLHQTLSKEKNSSVRVPWSPWNGCNTDTARLVWDSCKEKDNFRSLNLALEITELTGYTTPEIYSEYLVLAQDVKMGTSTPLPMSILADSSSSANTLEMILKLGGGWLLNNQISTGFDRIWSMPLAYIGKPGTIIWEYVGQKIKDILVWTEKMQIDPWNNLPININPDEDLKILLETAPRKPLSRFALALCVLVGQRKTLGLNTIELNLRKSKKMDELVEFLNAHMQGETDSSAWWEMVKICKGLL